MEEEIKDLDVKDRRDNYDDLIKRIDNLTTIVTQLTQERDKALKERDQAHNAFLGHGVEYKDNSKRKSYDDLRKDLM